MVVGPSMEKAENDREQPKRDYKPPASIRLVVGHSRVLVGLMGIAASFHEVSTD
jgi:hypothetical protein